MASRFQTCYTHLTDEELWKVDTNNLKPGNEEMFNLEVKIRSDNLLRDIKEKEAQITDANLASKVLAGAYKNIQKDIDQIAIEVQNSIPIVNQCEARGQKDSKKSGSKWGGIY